MALAELLDWLERDLNGSDARALFFKSRPRDLIRSQGGGDPARSDRWRILSHPNWLTWLGWRGYCPIWLFYAAVLALSLNVLPFEPFDQAFPADSRARPTKQLLTVDRCRTGERTRAGARMACELTRNKLHWSYRRPHKRKKLARRCSAKYWRCLQCSAQKKHTEKKHTGVAI